MHRLTGITLTLALICFGFVPAGHSQDAQREDSNEFQAVNVRIELVITDQRGAEPPVVKRVNVTVGDGMNGSIRSQSHVRGVGDLPLHADAKPRILQNGKILLSLQLQYDLPDDTTEAVGSTLRRQLQESVGVILADGVTLEISQSADPITDRRVTVEARATILR